MVTGLVVISFLTMMRWNLVLLVAGMLLAKVSGQQETLETETPTQRQSYGIDVSFPMQHPQVAESPTRPLGDGISSFYNQYLQGCRDFYKEKNDRCAISEQDRIHRNRQQPSTEQNYTSTGFAKVELPLHLAKQLQDYWTEHRGEEEEEKWPVGDTITNHWHSPSYMLPLSPSDPLAVRLTEGVRDLLEAWTGQSLVFTSFYGIRIYNEGSVLAPHVDRSPFVTSAVLNVEQDIDQPWPLEVIGHDGIAHNITLEPGEMVLYEGHSVIHGRPFPLKGRFYSNIYLHFEPHLHTERRNAGAGTAPERIKRAYEVALSNPTPKMKGDEIPGYIIPWSEEEVKWRQQFVYKEKNLPQEIPLGPTRTSAHKAAATGDLAKLKQLAKEDSTILFKPDRNGWHPIHEASRAGHAHVVEYLIEKGATVNERTNGNQGATPLWWAEQMFDDDHPVVQVLRRHGAINEPPLRDDI